MDTKSKIASSFHLFFQIMLRKKISDGDVCISRQPKISTNPSDNSLPREINLEELPYDQATRKGS